MKRVEELWARLGLSLNAGKTKIWAPSDETGSQIPEQWRTYRVPALKVLGQHVRVKVDSEGAPFCLGSAPSLQQYVENPRSLQQKLFQLNRDGLEAAIVHQVWLYASGGAVTHLLATTRYAAAELAQMDALQKVHVEWITERVDDSQAMQLARLPLRMGGIAVPDIQVTSLAVFVSAQSRLLPAVASLMPCATVPELLAADTKLVENIEGTIQLLKEAGCPSHVLPFGPQGPVYEKKAKNIAKHIFKRSRENLKVSLDAQQDADLESQSSSQASQWLLEACPGGQPQPDETWRTMLRKRLLQSAPGTPVVPIAGGLCANVRQSGVQCATNLERDKAHERHCPVGGGLIQRHNRCEGWLADKMRQYWRCPVREEKRTSNDIQGSPGRMDIIARRPEGTLQVDVAIASVASVDQAELKRRARDPGRAARAEVKKKLRRYGPSVLAFVLEDSGRLAPSASRLIRDLAGSQEEVPEEELYQKLVREVQHIVLANSASMLQAARGRPRTT